MVRAEQTFVREERKRRIHGTIFIGSVLVVRQRLWWAQSSRWTSRSWTYHYTIRHVGMLSSRRHWIKDSYRKHTRSRCLSHAYIHVRTCETEVSGFDMPMQRV